MAITGRKNRIFFYEFSDKTRNPLAFHTVEDFKAFCDTYGLEYSFGGNLENQFSTNGSDIHAMCLKGTKFIIFWNYKGGPSDYFIDREVKIFTALSECKFDYKSVEYSENDKLIRLTCNGKDGFFFIIWRDKDTFSYTYVTEGGGFISEMPKKCLSEDDRMFKMLKEMQNRVKKAMQVETSK